MSLQTFTALLHKEGNLYIAECPEVGTASQGAAIEEAVANLKEATELYLEEFPLPERQESRPKMYRTPLAISIERDHSMNQTASPQTPPDQHASQASAETADAPWQLDRDRQLLRHLYAQRDEQIEQLAALQRARAVQKSISIVESQIAMLNHAIRHAEEQATLHSQQTEIRRVE